MKIFFLSMSALGLVIGVLYSVIVTANMSIMDMLNHHPDPSGLPIMLMWVGAEFLLFLAGSFCKDKSGKRWS